MKKMMKKQEGFTLIELIIVIAILAIIAAVAVPNIIGAIDNSRKATDVSNGKVLLNAAAAVIASNDDLSDVNGSHKVNNLTATNDFDSKLKTYMSSNFPTPKYDADVYDDFEILISGDQITVYAIDTGSSPVAKREVSPEPDSAYDQD